MWMESIGGVQGACGTALMSSESRLSLFLLFFSLHLRSIFKIPSWSKMAVKLHHHIWRLTGAGGSEEWWCWDKRDALPLQEPSQNLHTALLLISYCWDLVTWPCLAAKLSALPPQIKSGFNYEGRRGERILKWASLRLCHRSQFPKRGNRGPERWGHLHTATKQVSELGFSSDWFLIFPEYRDPLSRGYVQPREHWPCSLPALFGSGSVLGFSVTTT